MKNPRLKRSRRRIPTQFELNITSLLDVMVIILVFLLKSYTASTLILNPAKGVHLPTSASPDDPRDSHMLAITPEGILLENERVIDFAKSAGDVADAQGSEYRFHSNDLDEGGLRIAPLYDALRALRQKSEVLRTKSAARAEGRPISFSGVLAIQADKLVSYRVLRKVMYTAGAAGFRTFRLLALKKES